MADGTDHEMGRIDHVGAPIDEVLALLPWTYAYTRGIARGCMDYRYLGRRWSVTFWDVDPELEDPAVEDYRRLAGVIAHVSKRGFAERLLALGKPVVSTSCEFPDLPFPVVRVDDEAIGRMGAEHFLTKGFSHFAFAGIEGIRYHVLRSQGFQRALTDKGLRCMDCTVRAQDRSGPVHERIVAGLAQFIAAQPTPLAVLAADDFVGYLVCRACRRAGVRVPVDVAVLGVNNDSMHAVSSDPPLSSIRLPLRRIGMEAAGLLARLIDGEPPPAQPILLAPIEVVTRESSDSPVVGDADVARALHYIRQHLATPFNVEDMVRALAVGRRGLEKKFARYVGRTPLAEIRYQRVVRVKYLLTATDLPVVDIAAAVGFTGEQQLRAAFRRETGMSPTAYRAANAADAGHPQGVAGGCAPCPLSL